MMVYFGKMQIRIHAILVSIFSLGSDGNTYVDLYLFFLKMWLGFSGVYKNDNLREDNLVKVNLLIKLKQNVETFLYR